MKIAWYDGRLREHRVLLLETVQATFDRLGHDFMKQRTIKM